MTAPPALFKDMRFILMTLALVASLLSSGQSVLESHIIDMDTTEVYTMKVRNLDNMELLQEYKLLSDVSKVYLYGGDYRVTYWCNDTIPLHVEYFHISSNDYAILQKFILRLPKPLKDVNFKEFNLATPEDIPQDIYMEF